MMSALQLIIIRRRWILPILRMVNKILFVMLILMSLFFFICARISIMAATRDVINIYNNKIEDQPQNLNTMNILQVFKLILTYNRTNLKET